MDYPQTGSTHYVRCLKCMKILKCSRYDTSTLLDHIRTDHPEIEIIDSSDKQQPSRHESSTNNEQLPERNPEPVIVSAAKDVDDECENVNDDAKVIYTRRYDVHPQEMAQSPRRRKLYRTSIERWRPADGSIYCPKCGCKKRPLIRTRAERFSTNQCSAACILGCWPFCFLPCLFPGDNKEYLHCANCKNFLGLYDREMNCVRPNREFIDGAETDKSEGTSRNDYVPPDLVDCDESEKQEK